MGKRDSLKRVLVYMKRNINLIYEMVKRNIKNTYRESVLGIIWTVLNPLLNMAVMAFVYTNVFGGSMIEMKYPVYILSGLIVYNTFFRGGTQLGLTSIESSRGMVLQTKIPITAYPRVSVYTAAVNFVFAFIAMLAVMLVVKQPFNWTLALTPILILGLLLLTMGVSYILAALYVSFKDIKNIYGVLTQLLMYLTPIFYTIDRLNNETISNLLSYNPMYYYVNYLRLLIQGHLPTIKDNFIVFGLGVFMYALGFLILNLRRDKIILKL